MNLRRLEEVSLNASATPRQLMLDGWMVRLSPGKAKRARSVNAFFASTQPLDDKLARCAALYRDAGLPLIFRITPFVSPPDLDDQLAARGFTRFETTAVMTADLSSRAAGARAPCVELDVALDAVCALRGTPAIEAIAHRERLHGVPLHKRGVVLRDGDAPVCAGLTIVEDGHAGLYDIITAPSHRGRGLATAVTAALLDAARDLGAHTAYLQVDRANAPARAMYHRAGFVDRYDYWYRAAPAGT